MSFWVAGAAVVVGLGTAYVQHDNAKKDRKQASKLHKEQMELARQEYEDWKDAFGGVQDNLGEYYNNLTPDTIEAEGLQAIEEEKTRLMETITEDFARRGLDESGLETALLTELEVSSAEERARVRAEAPLLAAREKSDFLKIGHGVQNNDLSNILGQQGDRLLTSARQQEAAAAQTIGQTANTTFGLLDDALNKKKTTTTTTTASGGGN